MKKGLIIAVIFLTGFTNLFGSHIPGGNLTWQCTGNPNEYIVTMQLFVSCPQTLGASYNGIVSNTCGLTNPTLTMPQLGVAQEVSQICPDQINLSDCPPGIGGIPGVLMYTYQATITLPAVCDSWDFAFDLCCRDASTNTNGGSSNEMYFHSQMNSATAPCDASPYVTAQPIPYVCAGQQQSYCPGAIDPDGDNLTYSLVNPLSSGAIPITHPAPYSPTAPLQNLVFDPVTGCITFNQPTTGNFVVTYLIEAWDNNGNLTGFIYHDFQFEVINNVNCQPPVGPTLTGISNLTGNALQINLNTIEICEGQSMCFDLTFSDPDALDTLSLDSSNTNLFASLPGATMTQVGQNPTTFTICWTVPPGASPNTQITVGVTDGSCPIENLASYPVIINVINSTVALQDTTICGPQAAQLTAAGGSIFNWSVLSGPPIAVGTNFSCNPCDNPIATPTATTTYVVTSNLSGGCNNTDTVTVTVVPDFTPTAFGDTLLCDYLTHQIGVNVNPAVGVYTTVWSPANTLNNSNILNPIASPTETTTYIATVTSPVGCTKTDSVTIVVSPPPSVTLVPGDSTICQGESLQFDVSLTAMEDDFTGGFDPSLWTTVSGASTGPPCVPFNGDALNFDAATRDLSTNPMNVSSCTSIDFCIWIANSSSTGTGCENADAGEDVELSYSTNGGATWVSIQIFDTDDWDATGPYNNSWQCFSIPIPAGAATANTMFQWAQIGTYGSTIDNWALDDISLNCGGSANYTYSWAPPAGLSATNINDPIATPTVTTTYTVTLTDTGGCSVNRVQTITVVPDFTTTVSQSSNSSCLFEPVQLDATVIPAGPGYTYTWTPSTYLNSNTIANPIANITAAGTHTYIVSISSLGGCTKTDSITIVVSPSVAPTIDILTPDSLMTCGDSILIDLDLGGGIPPICGPSPTNACSGPTSQTTIGTGTTNISSAPSPYYGFYEDGRVQMIYTAAEINAMGFVGGKITEIAFNITALASTQAYSGFTIKMGCTGSSDFVGASQFTAGLFQVYTTGSYTPVAGWNTHTLNTAYEWDGISNLIVEVCFDNNSWTSTDAVAQTATAVVRTLYDFTDGAVGCTLNTPTTSANRPNIRFTQCPTIPDPNLYTYSWSPNTSIITSTMQNPTLFPSTPTTYTVTVTDTSGGCIDTDSININVICGACYQPAITTTNPTCKDGTNGMIVIDPTFVMGSEVQSFTWKDSITNTVLQNTLNLTTGMQDSLINIGAGAYTITMVDSSGCSQDTTIWLTEPDSVVISSISPDGIICIGGNTQIDATALGGSGTGYTYTWVDQSTGDTIPGNGPHTVSPIISPTCYTAIATDDLGCISSSDQVCISLYPNLIASTTNDSIQICPNEGTNIDISAIGGSGTGYNYDWYENGILIGNGTLINVVPTSAPTTYTGVATDDCTTPADSITVFIDWFGLVIPDFTRNKPDSCYPITVQFSNTSTPASMVANSVWTFSDGSVINGDPATKIFNSPNCQDVTLTVTTIDGCVVDTTMIDYVCPFDYPVAEFYANPEIADLLNTDINFINQSTGLAPLSYLWNFNSGLNPDSSMVTNPTFTFPNNVPGNYPVVLQVTDVNGCVTDVMHTIIINGIYLFYVPNTFTPNGDGRNDTFKPHGDGIDLTRYTMMIFDRWGELLFETLDATEGWDGTYEGEPVPLGTYIWRIDTKEEFSPVEHKNMGHVNIIR